MSTTFLYHILVNCVTFVIINAILVLMLKECKINLSTSPKVPTIVTIPNWGQRIWTLASLTASDQSLIHCSFILNV